jgi:tRNA pseudouridine32 synthase/23S rRNA pseudouridine746 synthase
VETNHNYIHPLTGYDTSHGIPEQFTFPFYYTPHPIAMHAANQLQKLLVENPWGHNFGLDPNQTGIVIGKMFGVLIVEKPNKELAVLYAFSGKLADSNEHPEFVPPVFDVLRKDGFYKQGEEVVSSVNEELENFISSKSYVEAKKTAETITATNQEKLQKFKREIKAAKLERNKIRNSLKETESEEAKALLESLRKESVGQSLALKRLQKDLKERSEKAILEFQRFKEKQNELRDKRRNLSNNLQKKIFEHYTFKNAELEDRDLYSIFEGLAPAGAGECAAPKLLQFAYLNELKPIAMAEFWWGASPKSEVRKHKQFYPSCRGKCEPILGHMLKGLNVDPNPMLVNPAEGREIEIVHEEEDFLVINKPAEFLSVPGKVIQDSVFERIRARYPDATGPLIVHRLDQSTSGLMLIALNKDTTKKLQRQFLRRKVRKEYVAVLEGNIDPSEGKIELPLRVDLDDRPRQVVCEDYGKEAITEFKVIQRESGRTRILFYPKTGRTHQLRVHSAHHEGLDAPILGDDLYGNRDRRLHLHARSISFQHPVTKSMVSFTIEPDF